MLARLRNSQGIAMVVVIAMVLVLLSITGAALLLSGLNLKVASNMRTGMPLIQVADAGIQHALATVSQGTILPNVAWVLETNVVSTTTFPTGSGYSYVVTAVNGPATNQATLTSTANGPNSSKAVVQAVVERRLLPSVPGAFNGLGEVEPYFSGDGFQIDGRDYTLANALSGTNPDKLGISVGDITSPSAQTPTGAKNAVINALDSSQKDNVQGLGYVASPVTSSVDIDNSLTKQATTDLVNSLKGIADCYFTVKTGGDVTGQINNSTDANNNITIGGTTVNMGTTGSPKIVFFEGLPAGTTGEQRLIFGGNITGAGILVMKDNDLQFLGQLNWKGLVIVSGPDTSVSFEGGANAQDVLGGLIVSETDTDSGYIELYVTSTNLRIRSSKEALDMVQSTLNGKAYLKIVGWKQQL